MITTMIQHTSQTSRLAANVKFFGVTDLKTTEITFRPEAGKDIVKVTAQLPETVAEAVKTYGEEATLALIVRAATVDIQSSDRAMYNRTENPVRDPAKISEENHKYRPGVRQQRQSAVEKLKTNVAKLTPEERKQLLAQLQGESAAKKTHQPA